MLNFPILLWNIGFYFVCEKLIEMEQNYIVSIWAWKSHLWVVGTNRLEDYNKLPFVCRFCSLHWKTQFKKQHNSKKTKERPKNPQFFCYQITFQPQTDWKLCFLKELFAALLHAACEFLSGKLICENKEAPNCIQRPNKRHIEHVSHCVSHAKFLPRWVNLKEECTLQKVFLIVLKQTGNPQNWRKF